MKQYLFAASITLIPSAIFADNLESFEALSNQMNALMGEMMAKEVDAAGGDGDIIRAAVPVDAWNDEAREAATCILDRYEAEIGQDGIDEMMGRMESVFPAMSEMTMTEFTDSEALVDMQPEGMTEEMSVQITQECGMMKVQMDRMEASGFSAAMMQAYSTINQDN